LAAGTVLIIEDDFIQREGLVATLRQRGCTVLTSIDGYDALQKLSSGSLPDLILLDMLIPSSEGDGWWFLRQRRSNHALACVPVIITTAIPVADMKWATSLGAVGLIHKPFEEETLLAEIRRCLAGSGQEDHSCSRTTPARMQPMENQVVIHEDSFGSLGIYYHWQILDENGNEFTRSGYHTDRIACLNEAIENLDDFRNDGFI
jgi:CheY-like chemotaxis protein